MHGYQSRCILPRTSTQTLAVASNTAPCNRGVLDRFTPTLAAADRVTTQGEGPDQPMTSELGPGPGPRLDSALNTVGGAPWRLYANTSA